MFIETWLATYTFSKQDEAVKLWRAGAQFWNSKGIKSRVLLPSTGIMNKILMVMEFESAAARTEAWKTHRNTDEFQAAHKDFATGPVDLDSLEHYYYYEPE